MQQSVEGLLNSWSSDLPEYSQQTLLEMRMDSYAHHARDKNHNVLPHCFQLFPGQNKLTLTTHIFDNELNMLHYVHAVGRDRFIDLVVN